MSEQKQFHYGGQAVIEGVMIRSRKFIVTAVRKPDGSVGVDKQPLSGLYTGKLRTTPLIRGIIALIETLVIGMKTLMYSANEALEEEGEKVGGGWMWLMLFFSFAFAIALFFLAPLFLTRLLDISNPILFNIVDGLIRLSIFVLYLWVISLMPDIRRVFEYHGAEHKTVNGYETGAMLEPESLKKFSKAHIRCGGSFLFAVLIVAIIIFSLVGKPVLWLMILSRILLLPLIASLGYEIIYYGARYPNNIFVKIILAPGLWVQAFTTREPDDSQLEIAITALNAAIQADNDVPLPSVKPDSPASS